MFCIFIDLILIVCSIKYVLYNKLLYIIIINLIFSSINKMLIYLSFVYITRFNINYPNYMYHSIYYITSFIY